MGSWHLVSHLAPELESKETYYLLFHGTCSNSCSCPLRKSCSMSLQRSERFGTPAHPRPPAAHWYFIQNGCSPHSLLSEQVGFGWMVELHGSKNLWLSSSHLSRKGTLFQSGQSLEFKDYLVLAADQLGVLSLWQNERLHWDVGELRDILVHFMHWIGKIFNLPSYL